MSSYPSSPMDIVGSLGSNGSACGQDEPRIWEVEAAASAHGLNYLAFPLLYPLHGDQRVESDAWRAVGAEGRDDRSGPTPRSQWADHLPKEWRREGRSTSRHQNEPRGGARGGVCLTCPSCASSLAHDYPDRRHDHQDRRDGPVNTNCLA